MSSKKKKRSCPFSSSKPRAKKRKKAFNSEVATELVSSDKGSFYNQDEWLEEIASHEPDTSEQGIICWPGLGSGYFSMRQFLWFPTAAKICLFLVTCQTIIVQENGYLL